MYISKVLFVLLCSLALVRAQDAQHCKLLSHVQISERGSSIWGWTSPSGEEFALLGTELGLRIYSLRNPQQPEEVYFVSCTKSIWRELKTLGDYCYVVTEADDGLLIVDMTKAPNEFQHRFLKEFKDDTGAVHRVNSAHTIFADEKNYLYLAGARPIGSGCVILDAGKDFWNPVYVNQINETYFHEVYADQDVLFGADIYAGVLSIRNIQDRKKPQFINDARTRKNFTHAVWKEKNRNILYSADEVSGAPVEVWNIDNPRQIKKTDEWQVHKPWNQSAIPHNVFHRDDKLYVSYYTEGVRILDTKDPENLVEVAYYDTYTGTGNGFYGCWSIYPFFKNNVLIASDIQGGLFVLQYDLNQAAYIDINLVNKETRLPVDNALVELIRGQDIIENVSDLRGHTKTGYRDDGLVRIRISKFGYFTLDTTVSLTKIQTNSFLFELQELPSYRLSIQLVDSLTKENLADAFVKISMGNVFYERKTDDQGIVVFEKIYTGKWDIIGGRWGHHYASQSAFNLEKESNIILELSRGYQDDFVFDYGWTQQSNTPNVRFKRGDFGEINPKPSNYPSKDVAFDFGEQAMYTTNYGISDPAWVISGDLSLISPPMNLSDWSDLECQYSAWAYGGNDIRAIKKIVLRSGSQEIPLEDIPFNLIGAFNARSIYKISQTMEDPSQVFLVFYLENPTDSATNFIALRAAFDAFLMQGKLKVESHDTDLDIAIDLFPNPAEDYCMIANKTFSDVNIVIRDISGRNMVKTELSKNESKIISTDQWPAGSYIVYVGNDQHMQHKVLIKH